MLVRRVGSCSLEFVNTNSSKRQLSLRYSPNRIQPLDKFTIKAPIQNPGWFGPLQKKRGHENCAAAGRLHRLNESIRSRDGIAGLGML